MKSAKTVHYLEEINFCMILVDTNLVIYLAQLKLGKKSFAGHSINFSIISTIEALGYHELPVDELRILEKILRK